MGSVEGMFCIECQKKLLANLSQKNNSILFLGNSQTGAINHYKQGENTFISLLNEKAKISRTNIEAKAIWLPNANLREFEIILMSLKSCKVEPDILFLPIFLDDLRINSSFVSIIFITYYIYFLISLFQYSKDDILKTWSLLCLIFFFLQYPLLKDYGAEIHMNLLYVMICLKEIKKKIYQ